MTILDIQVDSNAKYSAEAGNDDYFSFKEILVWLPQYFEYRVKGVVRRKVRLKVFFISDI